LRDIGWIVQKWPDSAGLADRRFGKAVWVGAERRFAMMFNYLVSKGS